MANTTATTGTTIVSIRRTQAKTRQQEIPIYSLDYVAGDQRPHISLQSINENYMNKVENADGSFLEPNRTYLMNWEQIGENENPVTGELTPKYAMKFQHCDTSNALAWAIELKKFKDAFGDHKVDEQTVRAKFRKTPANGVNTNVKANPVAVNAGFEIPDVEEED